MQKKKNNQILFPLSLLVLLSLVLYGDAKKATEAIDIGLILDLETLVGKISYSCILMALSDFYATHNYTTRLTLHTRDSKRDIVEAASAAIDLLKNTQAQAILGPQNSGQAEFVVGIGNKSQVPVISFSATSPSLSSIQTPYFIRTAQNDFFQVKAIAAIVQAFGWRKVVPIYEDNEYGRGVVPFLTDAFQEINTHVPYRSAISSLATDDQILRELYKLMTMQTRVFVVHMSSSLGSRLFLKVKEAGMMSKGYAWILTDGFVNLLDSMDSSVIDSMQGVLGVKPYVPRSKELDNFTARWKMKFRLENLDMDRIELNVFGIWAYDTIWALAMAADKVGVAHSGFKRPGTTQNLTDLATVGVSQMGPRILKAMSKTRFNGLSGKFQLVDGQLQSSAFEIVNVIGKEERRIGIWTPRYGISEKLNPTYKKAYSASMDDLRPIIWPGESTEVPKGWATPTSGEKLRIGVPVKDGFTEFVKVERDPHTNASIVTGFCIDVFKAVVESMPYAVPYEFIPFEKANGRSADYYDDLIHQVYLQKYDAVVGDTTITANRSLYVDFTLPFTEAGISMIVPIKGNEQKNAWFFLKPLTMNLWLTSGALFIFTGFVVWVLEHRINEDFRGPPAKQVGMIFWFSFSTLVFAHKEKITSNLTRFVLIIWIFVVLVLTSSYTASLTSMLTEEQLTMDHVGIQSLSLVTALKESLNLDRSKLKIYKNLEDYDEALSRGTRNGGVAAIVDEIPYIKLFLSKYCFKYTVLGPIYQTGGFGFVFPKGSPLVHDVSTAVLNLKGREKMVKIERAWFGQQSYYPLQQGGTRVNPENLTLDHFKGLFLIAAVSSASALFVFLFIFLYEHRDILTSEDSVRNKIASMAKHFNQKHDVFQTPEKSKPYNEETTTDVENGVPFDMNTPQSPSTTIFIHTEEILSQEEVCLSSTEPSTPNHSNNNRDN